MTTTKTLMYKKTRLSLLCENLLQFFLCTLIVLGEECEQVRVKSRRRDSVCSIMAVQPVGHDEKVHSAGLLGNVLERFQVDDDLVMRTPFICAHLAGGRRQVEDAWIEPNGPIRGMKKLIIMMGRRARTKNWT